MINLLFRPLCFIMGCTHKVTRVEYKKGEPRYKCLMCGKLHETRHYYE